MGIIKAEATRKMKRKPDLCVKINRHCDNGDLLMEIYASLPFKTKVREWNNKWLDVYCWDLVRMEETTTH